MQVSRKRDLAFLCLSLAGTGKALLVSIFRGVSCIVPSLMVIPVNMRITRTEARVLARKVVLRVKSSVPMNVKPSLTFTTLAKLTLERLCVLYGL